MKLAIWILWPSFLVGAVVNALLFATFDPTDLHGLWPALPESRLGAYSFGFFACWGACACSSALTCFLQRGAHEVNRRICPLPNAQRPAGGRD